ncbi:MAG: kinase [Pseudomonadota bacterium]|nr:kinase [Pseudomonadota bacterium]MEC8868603.1 kinase [Pseudomonadota bacterium]MEC9285608.1 kinase [Pseudomonadota bacterium]
MNVLDEVDGYQITQRGLDCYGHLEPGAPEDFRQLAALLVDYWIEGDYRLIGIGGGQGSGKSTLCRLIASAFKHVGEKVAVLGIDDFYLPTNERLRLASEVHPLMATRGPPGTHDVDKLLKNIDMLIDGGSVRVPVFDKAKDDRVGNRRIDGPITRVIVEGWCVGASPMPGAPEDAPINDLERDQDLKGDWRRHINNALETAYGDLVNRFDQLAYLKVPNMAAVRRWRLAQEQSLPAASRKSIGEINQFVAHYERLTLWMIEDVPTRADLVVHLGEGHEVTSVVLA